MGKKILPNGPFQADKSLPLPTEGNVLTKTHCWGYSGHGIHIVTPKGFLEACSETQKYVKKKIVRANYGVNNVERIVHLFRNPFDNIVSRFHLQMHQNMKLKNKKWLKIFPDSKLGFNRWCKFFDMKEIRNSKGKDP